MTDLEALSTTTSKTDKLGKRQTSHAQADPSRLIQVYSEVYIL